MREIQHVSRLAGAAAEAVCGTAGSAEVSHVAGNPHCWIHSSELVGAKV